jgi:hypothetical protein
MFWHVTEKRSNFEAKKEYFGNLYPKNAVLEKSYQHPTFLCLIFSLTDFYASFRSPLHTTLIDRLFRGFWRGKN